MDPEQVFRLQKYAEWLNKHADQKGSPEFEIVAEGYRKLRQEMERYSRRQQRGEFSTENLLSGVAAEALSIPEGIIDLAQRADSAIRGVKYDPYADQKGWYDDARRSIRSLKEQLGYKPATSWEDVKDEWKRKGLSLDTLGEAAKFGLETGVTSLPHMFMSSRLPGVLAGSLADQTVQARERATGKPATATDWAIGAGTGLASTALERLGAERVIPGLGSVTGRLPTRIAKAATAEGLTEAPQEFVQYAGETAGTGKFSLEQGVERALAGGVGGFIGGGALRGAFEAPGAALKAGQVAARLPGDIKAQLEYRGDPEAVQSDLRVGNLFEEYLRQAQELNPNRKVDYAAVFKNVHDHLKGQLTRLMRDLRKAGIITPEQYHDFVQAPDSPIKQAAQHNRVLTEDTLGRVKALGLPSDAEAKLIGVLRDLDTASQAGLMKNKTGPVGKTMGAIGRAYGTYKGWSLGGPSIAVPAAQVAGTVGERVGTAIDKLAGLAEPRELGRIRRFRRLYGDKLDYRTSKELLADIEAQVRSGDLQPTTPAAKAYVRQREWRAKRRAENIPGIAGFDAYIYQNTGLRPLEVDKGLALLKERGLVTQEDLNDFLEDPESLKAGKRGLVMMDLLDDLARKGLLKRDPEWSTSGQTVPHAGQSPSSGPGSSAYEAQVQAANTIRDVALEQAPDPVLKVVVSSISAAKSRAEKQRLYEDALGTHPEARDYLETYVKPLTNFGPKGSADEDIAKALDLPRARRPFAGAPPGISTEEAASDLARRLKDMAQLGEPRRFWYEDSAQRILSVFGGDKERALRFLDALAITSPGTDVVTNFEHALRAAYQDAVGDPVRSGRFPNKMGEKLVKALRGEDWGGRKTDAFSRNLRDIIEGKSDGDVTVDIWIMRAFGYPGKDNKPYAGTPTAAQYRFVQDMVRRVADDIGWTPHQVQAAIWSAAKAQFENKPIEAEGGISFADAVERLSGWVSWESIPHKSVGIIPEASSAPPEVKAEFHQAVQKSLEDDQGNDILAKELGLAVDGRHVGVGVYKGETNPVTQIGVLLPKGMGTEKVDPSAKDLVEAYAAARGMLTYQAGMAWNKPVFKKSLPGSRANGVVARLKTVPTFDQMAALEKRLASFGDVAIVNGGTEIRFLNLSGKRNKAFHKAVEAAVSDTLDGTVQLGQFFADSGYIENDWEKAPDGQGYLEGLRARRPDLAERVDRVARSLRPRVAKVYQDFAKKYGWTLPGGFGQEEAPKGGREGVLNDPGKAPSILDQIMPPPAGGYAPEFTYVPPTSEEATSGPAIRVSNENPAPPPEELMRVMKGVLRDADFLPPNNPQMEGVKGLFDSRTGALYVRSDLDPADKRATVYHETGHAIDYAFENRLRQEISPFYNEVVKASQRRRPELWLPDDRLQEKWGSRADYVRNYRVEPRELLADAIAAYFEDPAWAKSNMPGFSKMLQREVRANPKLKKLIEFAAVGGILSAGLMGQIIQELVGSLGAAGDDEDRSKAGILSQL